MAEEKKGNSNALSANAENFFVTKRRKNVRRSKR